MSKDDRSFDDGSSDDSQATTSKWATSSSTITNDNGNVSAAAYRSSGSSSDDGLNQTSVSSYATPSMDENGNPVMDTVTQRERMVRGQQMPTETNRSSIPYDQIPSLQQGQQQKRLESE